MIDILPALDARSLGLLIALGVWTGLDQSACLQVLVSQPLVAAWLAGWACGDAHTGLAIGVLLQGVWSRALPMGASPLPVFGPGAVTAGALAALAPGPRLDLGPVLSVPGAIPLALSLIVGILVAEAGRPLLQEIFRRRGFIHRLADRAASRGDANRLRMAHLFGALPNAGLGLVLTGAGLLAGIFLLHAAAHAPVFDARWIALPVLGLGIGQAASLALGRRWWIWSVAVLAVLLAFSGWGS